MSFWNSSIAISLRSVVRRLGLVPLLSRMVLGKGYETAFDEAMLAQLRPGDTVWDIGANIGFYTQKFAEAVGPAGKVVAFEPSPVNIAVLRQAIGSLGSVSIEQVALGSANGEMAFTEGEDVEGSVARISFDQSAPGAVTVPVMTADTAIAKGTAPPTVLKLDVEGFEWEVLKGMDSLLASGTLRALCIEVHFGLLQTRGVANGPQLIEDRLTAAGYGVRWTDPSHIIAVRAG